MPRMSRRFTAHRGPVPSIAKAAPRPLAGTAPDPAGAAPAATQSKPREVGGPAGPEPTRYGDWERKGICVDF